jgi:polyphosphate glucokinase
MADLLGIDVGATSTKWFAIATATGSVERSGRRGTPYPGSPSVISTMLIDRIVRMQPTHVVIGFPGETRAGVIIDGGNLPRQQHGASPDAELQKMWHHFQLQQHIAQATGLHIGVMNDAELFLRGVLTSSGREIAVTLGTGCGLAGAQDGVILPLPDIGASLANDDMTFDQVVGESSRKTSPDAWASRTVTVLNDLARTFEAERIHLGGGNAGRLSAQQLADVVVPVFRHSADAVVQGALQYARELWGH